MHITTHYALNNIECIRSNNCWAAASFSTCPCTNMMDKASHVHVSWTTTSAPCCSNVSSQALYDCGGEQPSAVDETTRTLSTAAHRPAASCCIVASHELGEGYPPNKITHRNIRGLKCAKHEAHQAPRESPINDILAKA